MRILLCNTSESTGGAAIAARRLMHALRAAGEDAQMFVRDRAAKSETCVHTPACPRPLLKAKFVAERIGIWRANGWHKHRLFEVDSATHGTDLTRMPLFKKADVVHLHWINQGFFSLRDIAKILHSGKPLVWTLHDMWPLTGICHHSRECEGWLTGCGNCPILYKGAPHDLSWRRYRHKKSVYNTAPIHFVACSDWLADLARRAPLLQGHTIHSIPNPIDTGFYRPGENSAARKRLGLPDNATLVLFVAYKATDPNKGITYLQQAVEKLIATHPELKETLRVVIVGREATTLRDSFAVPTHTYEYVSDEETMRDFYRAVTVLAMPTLQDNLPNTIVEAMACGTPTVGFHVGGLPQLIAHRESGYLAAYKDASDFAEGITRSILPDTLPRLADACRQRAIDNFSQKAVAEAYMAVYQQALEKN